MICVVHVHWTSWTDARKDKTATDCNLNGISFSDFIICILSFITRCILFIIIPELRVLKHSRGAVQQEQLQVLKFPTRGW